MNQPVGWRDSCDAVGAACLALALSGASSSASVVGSALRALISSLGRSRSTLGFVGLFYLSLLFLSLGRLALLVLVRVAVGFRLLWIAPLRLLSSF